MVMKNLTEGNIKKQLIGFSIPIILGNIFQLTYNAVDSIIVGRFIGKDALAAVGTANPIMNIVILGITGICIGASVLMSSLFGAGKYEDLKKELSTTLLFGAFFSVVITLLGILCSTGILRLMKVPDDILGDASIYLKIIFLGMPFTYLYNTFASALRSVGDSKTPILFLSFASILNGLLDLIFIAGLGFGIAASALTTIIAEAASAILCIIYINRKVSLLRLERAELKFDRFLLKETLKHGSITALQQSCQPIGKLLIQGAINPLGVDMMAAFNAVNRVDDFAFTPEQSIASAMMTFVAQNRGAGKKERMRKGLSNGFFVEVLYWGIICIVITLFKTPIMKLFVSGEEEVLINAGTTYLGYMAFFYLLPAFTNGLQGFFRGMGDMKITLVGTITQISLRVFFVFLLVPKVGMVGVAFSSLLGWIGMLLVEIPYSRRYLMEKGN
ncbi:MAG TPA: MATE family efflux transporter [Lachnoclostridium phytofermentans]|uniref:Probable multidrug resistance protein NorM n=1 Tax=Lachnoclostridium phytofermentans TaxID=66219 RepID=A0A3D2X1R5_9FIRM|nr:MATE family efflux transporter [Lachnoclostridium sp.]HCL01090.1 MATE family efflux transporter [Lachnoclostridium phytofermentans]